MTSFNHYALGAVADWMHRTVAGIAPVEPGYATVLVAPRPGGDLTWARSTLRTRRGQVAVAWHVEDTAMHLQVTVPPGAAAVVRLPDGQESRVGPGEHAFRSALD